MRESWVLRFVECKIQVEVNKRRHQIGFSRAHGKTEKIIGICYAVKRIVEKRFVINARRIGFNEFFELFRNLFAIVVFQPCIFQQCLGSRIILQV